MAFHDMEQILPTFPYERIGKSYEAKGMLDDIRLLVVDDEEVICHACRRVFASQGFQVDTSSNPAAGLSLARENNYAVVLLDIKMPGMDGIQFLERLRETKPDLPVIIITGYPNISNAASAMRLGAADYVTKPFVPEQITQAVQRTLRRGGAGETARLPEGSPTPERWTAAREEFLFWDESWLQVGKDGTVRVGALLSRSQRKNVESVQLPMIGQTVYQGLPVAAVKTHGKSQVMVPSPVSGVVVAINEKLARGPSRLSDDTGLGGEIGYVCPTRLEEEVKKCRPRRVILANADAGSGKDQHTRLAGFGCQVHLVQSWQELGLLLGELDCSVLMIDADSFGERGPSIVEQIKTARPSLKTVVIASPESAHEAAYRQRGIFYYAVTPFADNEIVDILDAVFRSHPDRRLQTVHPQASPEWFSRICITDRNDQNVQLLTPPGLLRRDDGLGYQVLDKLRRRFYSVQTALEITTLGPAAILDAAKTYDRLLVLLAKDTGGLPGNLAHDTLGGFTSVFPENCGNLTLLVVQPSLSGAGPLDFDQRTTAALAEHIVREMESCDQGTHETPASCSRLWKYPAAGDWAHNSVLRGSPASDSPIVGPEK